MSFDISDLAIALSIMGSICLSVYFLKAIADVCKERKVYQNRPAKTGDIFVLWDWKDKRYNACFLVKQAYEGYYVGTMYLFICGKKRIRDIVAAVVLHKKGFKNTDIYESREISITDEEIKQVGFERV